MSEQVTDCFVLQDGENPAFFSYMSVEDVQLVNECGGIGQVGQIHFKETPERPIPQSLKEGKSLVKDVLVRLEPNVAYYCN